MAEKKLSIKQRTRLSVLDINGSPNALPSQPQLQVEKKLSSGPAHSIAAMMQDDALKDENRKLKEELETSTIQIANLSREGTFWLDATPAKKLDPSIVGPSKWANRHEDSFRNFEFENLKADIRSANGNVQAIKVRPIPGIEPQRYEIVFGHRRHRACLELKLPVLAIIESLNEQSMFEQMDRENRQRSDLRPYEQGEMYRRALDEGLYPSLRKLAEALGVSHSNVSRAVNIARLPVEILDAFPSRLEIQYRWIESLAEGVKQNPDLLISKAKEIIDSREDGKGISPKQVFDRLTNAESNPTGSREVMVGGKKILTIKESKNKVTFELGVVSAQKLKNIEKFILQTLAD
ncbi:ParB/RepB/Spo0J family partition protein [Polaromonas hydrogenivorans]|uniref:ParB/RepB/Spo0J family partition protein n=1 Tax=Polaromonas hydrogenivorans TaxID=335476 RepID=A0AAU7M089_9BURK